MIIVSSRPDNCIWLILAGRARRCSVGRCHYCHSTFCDKISHFFFLPAYQAAGQNFGCDSLPLFSTQARLLESLWYMIFWRIILSCIAGFQDVYGSRRRPRVHRGPRTPGWRNVSFSKLITPQWACRHHEETNLRTDKWLT